MIYRSLICLFIAMISSWAVASDNAVVLVYHHVGDKTPASTSVTQQQLREHLLYLSENHNVLPLVEVINTLKAGKPLPEYTVSITFDDGFVDILQNGHPVLKEFGFPYTIFINPGLIGKNATQLTWQQVQMMQTEGVTFANHTTEHLHLLKTMANESVDQWLTRTVEDVLFAEQILTKKTGKSLKYVAYPYGEYNLALANRLSELGFTGFAQHSGPISSRSDFTALSRFAAAGPYANLKTLKTKLRSLMMPITHKSIEEPQLSYSNRRPQLSFSLNTDDLRLGQLNCFYGGDVMALTKNENSVQLHLEKNLKPGRSRFNCTVPSINNKGRYYWFSQPWFVPTENGDWLE